MRVLLTVTNELNYDQRMIRICDSLVGAGFDVKLIGVKFKDSPHLEKKDYHQKRIRVFSKKGFSFYVEYNLKLFLYLLFQKTDMLCCIDLDTMLPVYYVSVFRRKTRVYDAHEYFSQLKEVVTRPFIYRFWHFVENTYVPKFKNGYTVSQGIAEELKCNYSVNYEVIKNVPLLKTLPGKYLSRKQILYRGSVNEARGFEFLIPAMKNVNAKLIICGEGNFLGKAKELVEENGLGEKVIFMGRILPSELEQITNESYIGVNLVEAVGKSQILSLANKFFDYIHHAIPQVTMNFPEYKKINDQFEVAILIDELTISSVANVLNELLQNEELYQKLRENCMKAREVYNWQKEEQKLINFYKKLSE
jgi:glycosyltransferase involved in cell wall biosynthesis